MVRIIDATLTKLDNYPITKKQILQFCKHYVQIGITDIEISKKVYQILDELPKDIRFYLNVSKVDNLCDYPGIYKFIYHNGVFVDESMNSFQVNDIREIVKLRAYNNLSYVRIIGLDDLICHNYNQMFQELIRVLPRARINFTPENGCGCGSALAILWVLFGQKELTTSFTGIGSMAATEEVIMALRITLRVKPNQNLENLQKLKMLFEEIIGRRIKNSKPVIGSHIFHVESGVHVDGILKNPSNYEAYSPEIVGLKTKITIGKHSGTGSVKQKLFEVGLETEDELVISQILRQIKIHSSLLRRSLSEEEFIKIVREVISYDGETDVG